MTSWNWAAAAGASACPNLDPVQLSVGYLVRGHAATASLPGFGDLSLVPCRGCDPAPGSVGAVQVKSSP